MRGFLDFDYYRFMFQQYSDALVVKRYIFSVSLRIVTLVIAMGLFFQKEIFRKAVIALGLFTLGTLMIKHPYHVFYNIAMLTEQHYHGEAVTHLMFPWQPWVSMILYISLDAVFAGTLIYYFTRSKIKSQFD